MKTFLSKILICVVSLILCHSVLAEVRIGEVAKELAHLSSLLKNNTRTSEIEVGEGMSVTKGTQNTMCPQFQVFGFPVYKINQVASQAYYTCRLGYAGMYSPSMKTPLWVAEHLEAQFLRGNASREGIDFSVDKQILMSNPVNGSDYKKKCPETNKACYDRGHLSSAEDNKFSQTAMNQSFLYTNTVPQVPNHNRGIWANLEASVRELAARRGEIYVVTGPIFSSSTPEKIGSGVPVPDALFKVLVDPNNNTMTAFVIPNRVDVGDAPEKYQVTVRDVEKLSGLNFNAELDRATADKLEVGGGDWPIPKVRIKFKD